MVDEELIGHLVQLGLGDREASAYATLLRTGPVHARELAGALRWEPGEVETAVIRLTRLGLVTGASSGDAVVKPAEPSIALESLTHEQSASLLRARTAAANAYDAYRRTVHPQPTEDLVEVVTGPEIIERIHQIEGAAESEVLRFDSPPYHTQGRPNEEEIDSLARHVEYRVVYSRSAVQNADYYACNIKPCIAAGEQARVLPTVPVKLTVFDRRVAFVSMSFVEAEINDSMLIVYPSSLLSALIGLFETSWRTAFPMHLGDRRPPALNGLQRRILELLATGITDAQIAQLLGISRRTLSRHLEQLTCNAGAVTRFQLALHASRRGWI
ncbi:helix-turn-helix transcriptional regulator [Sphaerisporangium fuscum]|uniref:helix-turn-helix transcriptional regulator n=1 Tax=Sphaerisporangium fuscum TaxID=2835868 RepID=UPI001BDCB2FA|nr:helix-turn-helix transcriptional regulator [Sphaerisporangium fuscum]